MSSGKTVERTFFNLRFTVPGFIFIIVFLLINPDFFSQREFFGLSISETQGIFSLILGFLTLVSGTPIGFLVSQMWWLLWDLSGAHYGDRIFRGIREPYIVLVRDYNINYNRNDLRTIYNYLIHSKSDVDTRLYIHKRWDTFILLGSSAFSILLGLVIGYFMRKFVFETTYTDIPKIYHIILIISFSFLFSYLVTNCYWKVLEEHDNMSILLIRRLGAQNLLRDIVPEQYFTLPLFAYANARARR